MVFRNNETEIERSERIAEVREMLRSRLLDSPEIKQLRESGQLDVAIQLLEKRERPPRLKWEVELPLDLWVMQTVQRCLAPPDVAETMTAKGRREHAAKIEHHAEQLWGLIAPFMRSGAAGFGWPFQPSLDYLALELSLDYTKDFDYPEDELEDAQHRSRYAMYYLLMNRMEDVLATFVQCGQHFADTETVLKKPNDPNARRLYFLRVMTDQLCRTFRAPCRGVSLALASAFFDCSDLDEASVSKLAPVKKSTPVEIPVEHFAEIVTRLEERIAQENDPERLEEMNDHLNFYRGIIAKSSG